MCANFRDPDSKIPSPASVSAARRLLLRRRRRLMLGNELASTEVDEFTGRMPPPPHPPEDGDSDTTVFSLDDLVF